MPMIDFDVMRKAVAEIEELRECELDLLKRLDKAEDEIERLRAAMKYTGTELGKAREEIERLQAVVDAAKKVVPLLAGPLPDGSIHPWPEDVALREALAALEDNDE